MSDFFALLAFFVTFAVWALVPILATIMIYRQFPASPTSTEWTILGLSVKAGGASGFCIAMLALGYFKFLDPTFDYIKSAQQPYWVVDAPIMFQDAEKNVVNAKSTLENLTVLPIAHDFKKISEKRYLVTLKFSAPRGAIPDNVQLIFPEGEGFIELKKLRTIGNTSLFEKKIDLTQGDPIVIRPPVSGGQNQTAAAGLAKDLGRSLESNDRSR